MTILIYKILLGILVIAVIMATLDRSVLIFIEESIPIIKQQQEDQQEGFWNIRDLLNRQKMNQIKKQATSPKTRIQEAPLTSSSNLTQNDVAVLRSLEFANPMKEFAVNNYNSFCNKTNDNLDDIETRCNTLDEVSCKRVDCCVLLNSKKCVSGGLSGPNFGWKDENGIQRPQKPGDYYYYKDKLVR